MADQATDSLQTIMQQYASARRGEAMTPQHPVVHAFASLQRWMEAHGVVQAHPNVRVRWSVGVGRWAKVPWIALLDGRETSSTQRGLFCSLLFRSDMQGAYLALEQGTRSPAHGGESQETLLARGAALRQELQGLAQAGFALHGQIDLGDLEPPSSLSQSSSQLHSQAHYAHYAHYIVAHKYYERGALPSEAELVADVAVLVQAYETQVEARTQAPAIANAWLFQANPQAFNLRSALGGKAFTWPVKQHAQGMRAGDRVYFWESGPQGGLVGTGVLQGAPEVMTPDAVSRRASRKPTPPKEALRVWVQPEARLPQGVPRAQVLAHPELANMAVVRTPMAVNFEVTAAEQRALVQVMEQASAASQAAAPRPTVPLAAQPRLLSEELAAALRAARVHVSPGLETQLHALLSCLWTRSCVLAFGPSGSGKTLLGQCLAEFWGGHALRCIAPRGDSAGTWLCGAPQGVPNKGRQLWQMTPALQLLCKAAGDPRKPYLLIVDDVQAASLRGKLADAAACAGGSEPCLPAVKRDPDGQWRAAVEQRMPWPANLTLLALANTEAASSAWQHARLDPWGLVPWVATAEDIPPRYAALGAASEASPGLLRAWLQLSQDATWHEPYGDGDAGRLAIAKIMELGKLCDGLGMPLGHRFFMTARRFAALFAETAQATSLQCVDQLMVMQVVPRLLLQHPEVPLGALLRFTWDLSPNGQGTYDSWEPNNAPACLPRSHAALLGH